MNKEWSELNKTMQTELKKRGTFNQGMFRRVLLSEMVILLSKGDTLKEGMMIIPAKP